MFVEPELAKAVVAGEALDACLFSIMSDDNLKIVLLLSTTLQQSRSLALDLNIFLSLLTAFCLRTDARGGAAKWHRAFTATIELF